MVSAEERGAAAGKVEEHERYAQDPPRAALVLAVPGLDRAVGPARHAIASSTTSSTAPTAAGAITS